MLHCPACGTENPDGASQCLRCHLSAALFGAVQEAAGDGPDAHPQYLKAIGDILAAVDEGSSTDTEAESGALLSTAHRFPSSPALPLPTPLRCKRTAARALVGSTVYGPTAAILNHVREVGPYGRRVHVGHIEQPFFAWR